VSGRNQCYALPELQQWETARTENYVWGDPAAVQAYGKGLDTAGNGFVTKDEYLAAAQNRFARMDSDGDGKLTPDELASPHDKHGGKQGKSGGGHAGFESTQLIGGSDKNSIDRRHSPAHVIRGLRLHDAGADDHADVIRSENVRVRAEGQCARWRNGRLRGVEGGIRHGQDEEICLGGFVARAGHDIGREVGLAVITAILQHHDGVGLQREAWGIVHRIDRQCERIGRAGRAIVRNQCNGSGPVRIGHGCDGERSVRRRATCGDGHDVCIR